MSFLDLIFPRKCLNCNKEGSYLCKSCLAKCRIPKPVCPYCERASIDGITHSGCKKALSLDGLTSVWNYEGVIRKSIIALKYKFAFDITKELSNVFIEALKAHNSLFLIHDSCVLVPIPLSWYRKNWRGFNQSEEIGKIVADKMGWKFEPDLLVRRRLTIPQAGLKADKRSENIRGVFSLNPNHLLPSAYCLVLFDDVWTTGSTMKEAAKVLKRAGAGKVWGLTVAR